MITFIIPTFDRSTAVIVASLWAQTCGAWRAIIVQEVKEGLCIPPVNEDAMIRYATYAPRHEDWHMRLRTWATQFVTTPYIVHTNDDNYYCPSFVDQMLAHVGDGEQVVACDILHNHHNQVIQARPGRGGIDLGAMVVPMTLANRCPLPDPLEVGQMWDGIWAEELTAAGKGFVRVPRCLFVHN